MLCEDALWMELDSTDLVHLVSHRHDETIVGTGGDLELGWKTIFADGERMVASSGEPVRDAVKQTLSIVEDLRALAMAGLHSHDARSIGRADRLVAQADPENGELPTELPDSLDTDSRALGGAGPGREYQRGRGSLADAFYGDGVVANDFALLAELLEVAGEVVDKAVKVVDE